MTDGTEAVKFKTPGLELHFVCNNGEGPSRLPVPGRLVYQSGTWKLSEAVAEAAVGGWIYLHQRQSSRAYHGGMILEVRNAEGGRKTIVYEVVDATFRDKRCTSGWGREKAVLRSASAETHQ